MRKLCLLAILGGLVSAQAQQPFSIDQILNYAFPSDLAASPAGGKVAWVVDDRGPRNVWIAEPPAYQGRAVTHYTKDDGQEITELAFTPDGNSLVFVRGGDANRAGEIPNPTADPKGADQSVWVVAAGGGEPVKLGEGHFPAISLKGDRVAFVNKNQIWSAAIDGKGKAAQLVHARGVASGLRWSPDSSKLAFASIRGDHAFIGVYDTAARTVQFLDPSVDDDSEAAWSPDSRQVAFVRIPASRAAFNWGARREGEPWSIHVADATTGKAREIWKADRGYGSMFRVIVAQNQLLWGAGDRIVFPWERDGWTHLYSVAVDGGKATLLTPGAFEVEYASLSPDAREVVLSSNQDDIDRRHIFRVAVSGGTPTAVTSGSGIEWQPVITSDGKAVAFLSSDARHPAHPAIRIGSGAMRDIAPGIGPDFPLKSLVEPQQVILSSADGMRVHAQLFLPPKSSGERHPGVIFFHGGSRRQMLLGWHYMYYYHNSYAMNQYLASRGYVVLAVNYRSGIGYGMEFREAINYGASGATEYNDVMGAGLYMRGRSDVDPKRIGLWGGSYGGYLTALGLSRSSELFAAGVDLHGVHNWNTTRGFVVPADDPQAYAKARLAFQSSPMSSVKTWRSPVLLIQGDDDRNVPFGEMVKLADALREQGTYFEQLVFPDEVHDFLTHAHWLDAYHAADSFFERFLRKPRAKAAGAE